MSDARSTSPSRLDILAGSARAFATAPDVHDALVAVLTDASDAVGAIRGAIAVQDPDRPELELVAVAGMDDPAVEATRTALTDPDHPIGAAVRSRRVAWDRPGVGEPDVIHADIPLTVTRDGMDRTVGVLLLAWAATGAPDAESRRFLEGLADLVALAIDRALLASLVVERAEWFERIAHSDPLTGLANDRTFARVLELELARAARQGGEVSVLVADVDDFRAVNDRHGREAGDDILRAVAAALAESVRLVDTVARSSGDEFVVVAPGPAGLTVARRILAAVASLPGGEPGPIAVSIGIARFPVDGTAADELVAAARTARLTARSGGAGIAEAAGRATA